MRIRTNVASLSAQNALGRTTDSLRSTLAQLSSGTRINKAADDAAGLAVSESLKAGIRSLEVARRNASDGVSMVQTAEGGLNETTNMLIRLRELAVQGASDTIGQKERGYLNKEFMQLKNEIDRIATVTEFNGNRLLAGDTDLNDVTTSGNVGQLEIQVDMDYYQDSDDLDMDNPVNIIKVDFSQLNAFNEGLGLGKGSDGIKISNKEGAQGSIEKLDSAMDTINEYRSYLGSIQNRLQSTLSNLSVKIENKADANSRIRDTDYAQQTADFTKYTILQQAGTAVLSSANAQPQIALALLGGK